MPITKRDLVDDLPEHKATIEHLISSNGRFARLLDDYHQLDDEVHRMVNEHDNPGDDTVEKKKRELVHTKDALYAMVLDYERTQS